MLIWYYEDSDHDLYHARRTMPQHDFVHICPEFSDNHLLTIPEGKPDLICVDTILIAWTGFEVVRELSKIWRLRKVPIMMVSGAEPLLSKEWKSEEDRISLFCGKPLTQEKIDKALGVRDENR